jgi:hypothetical protein
MALYEELTRKGNRLPVIGYFSRLLQEDSVNVITSLRNANYVPGDFSQQEAVNAYCADLNTKYKLHLHGAYWTNGITNIRLIFASSKKTPEITIEFAESNPAYIQTNTDLLLHELDYIAFAKGPEWPYQTFMKKNDPKVTCFIYKDKVSQSDRIQFSNANLWK